MKQKGKLIILSGFAVRKRDYVQSLLKEHADEYALSGFRHYP